MKRAISLLVLISLSSPYTAGAALEFSPKIENEQLAEESILLLQCLSQKSGEDWQFTESPLGSHWLQVRQREDGIEGTYRQGGKEENFSLKTGEAETVCAKLLPTSSNPVPEHAPQLSTVIPEPRNEKKWIWAGGIALALLGGILYWKSQQPDHKGYVMR